MRVDDGVQSMGYDEQRTVAELLVDGLLYPTVSSVTRTRVTGVTLHHNAQ